MRFPAFLFLLAMASSFAQSLPPHFVRASGEATVTTKPDRAYINIGVVTHAATAQAASTQNATQTTQVIASVRQTLGSAGEVKTSGYSLNAQYDYSNGHPAHLTGYDASNTVLVTVDELSVLGKIIDAATATGANNITGISFTLKDNSAIRAEALSEAAAKARNNAEVLAKALNVQVVGLLEAEPSEASIRPLTIQPRAMMAMASPAAPTPIESGSLDIHATVTVTLEVR